MANAEMAQGLDQYVSTVSHSAILCSISADLSIDVAGGQQFEAIEACQSRTNFLVQESERLEL